MGPVRGRSPSARAPLRRPPGHPPTPARVGRAAPHGHDHHPEERLGADAVAPLRDAATPGGIPAPRLVAGAARPALLLGQPPGVDLLRVYTSEDLGDAVRATK